MNQTITLAPGDTLIVIGGPAGSTTTPTPQPQPQPQPQPGPAPAPPGVKVIELPYAHGERTYTSQQGGWSEGETIAFHFRTGSVPTDGRGIMNIAVAVDGGAGGKPAPTEAVISTQPGDFTPISNNMASTRSEGGGDTRTIGFGVGWAPMGITILQPDTDYYFNVRYTGEHGGNVSAYLNFPAYLRG